GHFRKRRLMPTPLFLLPRCMRATPAARSAIAAFRCTVAWALPGRTTFIFTIVARRLLRRCWAMRHFIGRGSRNSLLIRDPVALRTRNLRREHKWLPVIGIWYSVVGLIQLAESCSRVLL